LFCATATELTGAAVVLAAVVVAEPEEELELPVGGTTALEVGAVGATDIT
jgi:hypothetical protein